MRKKRILALLTEIVLLSGCGQFELELPGASAEYTVIDPNNSYDNYFADESENEFSTIQTESVENYVYSSEEYSDTEIWDSRETIFEETEEASENVTVIDEDMFVDETEAAFSTVLTENVENIVQAPDNPQASEEAYVTDSDSGGNNPESSFTVTIYRKNADVSQNVLDSTSNMTAEQKAAQLILARCPSDNAVSMMEQYNFGGYTLYARDFENMDKDSAEEYIGQIKKAAKITPFIAVDEEGGTVNRVSKFTAFRASPFDSIGNIYAEKGIDGITENSAEKAKLLTSIEINMNLAPVADIAESGDYIFDRTAGTDAENTGKVVREIIDVSGRHGLMSCIKHFPGYGNNIDTHTGISRDSRSLESFRSCDFIPFKEGIASPYQPAVLVNHNIVECMDNDLPASLSPEVHRILREELGFNGVIITDDLGMDGIKAYTGSISPYVMGIMSGNDLLCVSEPVTAYNDLIAAINDGTLPIDVVDEHVNRILRMKYNFGLNI